MKEKWDVCVQVCMHMYMCVLLFGKLYKSVYGILMYLYT